MLFRTELHISKHASSKCEIHNCFGNIYITQAVVVSRFQLIIVLQLNYFMLQFIRDVSWFHIERFSRDVLFHLFTFHILDSYIKIPQSPPPPKKIPLSQTIIVSTPSIPVSYCFYSHYPRQLLYLLPLSQTVIVSTSIPNNYLYSYPRHLLLIHLLFQTVIVFTPYV